MKSKVMRYSGVLLATGFLFTSSANAFNLNKMMNPTKWFKGSRGDDYYDDRYGPGYPPPPPPGYGYGGPGYGYGGPGPGYGYGGPGYQFAADPTSLALHHQVGTFAYANSGSTNTNGSQFYITEVVTDFLDGGYEIFGHCEPLSVIQALTSVPTSGPPNDRPLEDVHLQKVTITRCAP